MKKKFWSSNFKRIFLLFLLYSYFLLILLDFYLNVVDFILFYYSPFFYNFYYIFK